MAQVWPAEISVIARTLAEAGYQAYLVGGAVRDHLLGLSLHDFDLTTDARPAELRRLFPGAEEVGAHFGVILLRRGELAVQVATFRSESSYRDGRRPGSVTFESDVRADVARRDFTINALLEDPLSGEVLDFVGGRADLEARLVRAVGAPGERFAEDHLRMLRAVRFAARLGFAIEPATLAAVREQASSIGRISAERVRDELTRILTEGGARRGLELLDESGLLREILPEVSRLKGVAQPPEFHPEGDVWVHTLGLLERLHQPTLELALAALLHDVGKPDTQVFAERIRFSGHDSRGACMSRQILGRLRFSNETIDRVASLVGQHMMFNDALKMGEARFRRFVRQPEYDELFELYRLDLAASARPLERYQAIAARRAALAPEQLHPTPLLSGRDLIALGYTPGPRFAEILHAIEEGQLDGSLATREQAIARVRQISGSTST